MSSLDFAWVTGSRVLLFYHRLAEYESLGRILMQSLKTCCMRVACCVALQGLHGDGVFKNLSYASWLRTAVRLYYAVACLSSYCL